MKKRIAFSLICILFLIGCQEAIQETEEHEDFHEQPNNFTHYIGKDLQDVIADLKMSYEQGPSRYGYEWAVFKNENKYISVGHVNSKVKTIVLVGENVIEGNFSIGDKYEDVTRNVAIQNAVTVHNRTGEYRFELTEEERNARPLVQLTKDVYAQLYFDRFTKTLVAVRFMDDETLLKHRPYRLVYRGNIKKYTSAAGLKKTDIDRMNEKQIYDVTNIIRKQYGKSKLIWSSKLANVAFLHSKDMKENDYFAHVSPTQGDLKKRLKKGNIAYTLAGENIAAGYPDGLDAVIGWLNSPDHREALLNGEFTHIGVGVFDKYYTQNFIKN